MKKLLLPLALLCGLSPSPISDTAQIVEAYGKIPLAFTLNQGQTDSQVKFTTAGNGASMFFAPTGTTFLLSRETAQSATKRAATKAAGTSDAMVPARNTEREYESFAVKTLFVGANANPKVVGEDRLAWNNNYFVESDPANWRTDVPNYGKIRLQEVYSGIDLVYYGNKNRIKYDFVVRAGKDPSQIVVQYELGANGGNALSINGNSELVVTTPLGDILEKKPYCYQKIDGKEIRVSIRYRIIDASLNSFGFEIGAFNTGYDLNIDPELLYSTFLGGNSDDGGYGIVVDSSGNAYVTGWTRSSNYPVTSGPYDPSLNGQWDAFVAKLNADGNALLYSTFLGGGSDDIGYGLAVDSSGHAYVTGYTESSGYPVTNGAYDTSRDGNHDAFVTKLSAGGNALVYSTFLGGASGDIGFGIAVDNSANAYVTGRTNSSDFPVTSGAYGSTFGGYTDAFVTKLNADGNALFYSTFLGGSGYDFGTGIAVDSSGNTYLSGGTTSSDYPVTSGAYDTSFDGGSYDAFVTKLNAGGNALLYSTFLGGSGYDYGYGISVDSVGNAFVTGWTQSSGYPVTSGAYDTSFDGSYNAFVTKLNAGGNALLYSTFLGGGIDTGYGIVVDSSGNAYVTGYTGSSGYPVTDGACDTSWNGGYDVFLTKLDAGGNALLYSTFLGGGGDDQGYGITVDSSGNAYVTGRTHSGGYPVTSGAYDTSYSGDGYDAFVTGVIMGSSGPAIGTIAVTSPNGGEEWEAGSTHNITWTSANVTNVRMDFSTDNGATWREITPSTAALTGSYAWTVPDNPSTNCLISITDVSDASVTDTADNAFAIYRPDNTPPVLTCPPAVAAEATSAAGGVVNYAAATATDLVTATPTITYSQESGTTFSLGTTTVTVTASDAAGNSSSCSFTATVRDTTPPVLTCPFDVIGEATSASGAVVSYATPAAADLVTASPTIGFSQASGTTFPIGTTTVSVTARDAADNTSTCSFIVTVSDTTPPALTSPSNVIAESTSASGAVVSYAAAIVMDLVTASPTIGYSQASGTTFPIGTTTVTVTASDAAGNTSSSSFTVTVRDTTPPVLTCPSDVITEPTSAAGAVVSYPSATATDSVTASPTIGYSQASGTTFPIGTTTVSVTARDAADNPSTCSFIVTVSDTTPPELTSGPIITTVAGTGTHGFSGDGGAATAAQLFTPRGVAMDGAGNLYLADTNNHRIRKVTAATGVITTVAGGGSGGLGDGGAATAAALFYPGGVAVDGAGNLYLADSGNQRIRKVAAATGLITTVAGTGPTVGFSGDGGAATEAEFRGPSGVAVDGDGNLYVADRDNHRIRKVTAATGIITTVAGTGITTFSGDGGAATAAALHVPSGVAVDGAGNLYIADYENLRIRKVSAATGIITTVAGTGNYGFSGDGGAATAARLARPNAVAVDGAGNLYISDSENHRIRKVTAATGVITTVAGTGVSGFSGDGGVAIVAALHGPSGVAVDGAGNLYVADTNNGRIRKVESGLADTTPPVIVPVVTGTAGSNGWYTSGVTVTWTVADGESTIASQTGCGSTAIDADTPGTTVTCAATSDGGTTTQSVTIQRDTVAPTVTLVTPAPGASYGLAAPVTAAYACADPGGSGLASCAGTVANGWPVDTASAGAKTFAVAATDAAGLQTMATVTYTVTKATPELTWANPTSIASGTALSATQLNATASFGGAAVDGTFVYTPPAGTVLDIGTGQTLSVTFTPADAANYTTVTASVTINVTASTAASIITTVAGTGVAGFSGDGGAAMAAALNWPEGVAVDGAGNVYLADRSNNRIRKVTAATGVITTVAGTGSQGFSGDGGPATAAALYYPVSVAVDGVGNLYLVDYLNNRIRKVTAATGVITTVAGTGSAGFSGDGEAATAAQLYQPRGVAVDGVGNLYIADYENLRIRKVTAATGVITTVAGTGAAGFSGDGGAATAAQLYYPYGVTVDGAGNLYLSDSSNNRIRKVTAATGVITTVAGTGSAGFSGDGEAATTARLNRPYGVAVDGAGDLYLADYFNNRIRKVTAATGVITTVAGTGVGDFSGDGGAATAARLNRPYGVAVDGAGNVYLADTHNHRIRKVESGLSDATPPVIVPVVTGTQGSNGWYMSGVTVTWTVADGESTIVSQTGCGSTVIDFDTPGTTVTCSATSEGGTSSQSVTIQRDTVAPTVTLVTPAPGASYGLAAPMTAAYACADPGGSGIASCVGTVANGWPVDTASAGAKTFAVAATDAAGLQTMATVTYTVTKATPEVMWANPASIVYGAALGATQLDATASFGGAAVDGTFVYTPPAGTVLDVGTGQTLSVTFTPADAANYTTVTASVTINVTASTAAPIITTVAGTGVAGFSGDGGAATAAALNYPHGVAVDGAGNLYLADRSNNRIRKVAAGTGVITTVAGTGAAGFSGDGGAATAAALNEPAGVAVDGAGNLYLADSGNSRIRKVTAATGVITTVTGGGSEGLGDGGTATAAGLGFPSGVAVDGAGNLYIAVTYSHRIRKVTAATGIITTVAGTGDYGFSGDGGAATTARLNRPDGVAVDGAGNLYVADRDNHRIRKVTAATGIITTVAGTGELGFSGDGGAATEAALHSPTGVAVDGAGNVYLADRDSNRIRKVTAATGVITTVAGTGGWGFNGDGGAATTAQLGWPYGVAVDRAGNLYLGDSGNHRIRKVESGLPDATPPVIVPVVTGTAGSNGWYTSGVTVTWTVADGESTIVSQTGCGSIFVDFDTPGTTVTCAATSDGGTTTQSVTIQRDTVAPTVTLVAPAPGASYGLAAPVTAAYECADPGGSGLASCAGTVANGVLVDTASAGAKTFAVAATDAAGLQFTTTVTYTVTKATPELTWTNPTSIASGTALSATQLNATASFGGAAVDGTFVYTPPAGTVLDIGTGLTLSVTFTPADGANYTTVTATVAIDVVGNTPQGTDVTVAPIDSVAGGQPVTLTFAQVTSPGTSHVATTGSGEGPPAGFAVGNPAVYYAISTTAGFSPPVTVCINTAGVVFEGAPTLFHFENGAWVDRTSSVTATSVCGVVPSLSPFAVFARKPDTTPPEITSPGNQFSEAATAAGAIVTYPDAHWTDAVAGTGTATCVPASGSVFALGTTTVTCTATDGTNSASIAFSVTVADSTAPVVTVPSPMTVEAAGPNGAVVTFVTSGVDAVAGSLTPTCTPATGSLFSRGLTTVTCTVTDPSGNTGSGSFTITVQDSTSRAVTVQLRDSRGNPISGGVVQYYSGGWLVFGTTGADGSVSKELPARTYTFSMTYASGRQEKSQSILADATVVFQTTEVTVELRTSAGNLLTDQGTVQYYAGGWRTFGTTSGGQAHLELLPLTYTFSMTYASGRQEKSQNIAINPTVVFQTTTVTVELRTSAGNLVTDPGTVQYYAGGWRTFGTTSGGQAHLELLPLTYTFSMTYASGRQEKSQNVAANATVVFQTTTVTVELRTGAGNLLTDQGTVQYYAGGWRTFGTTSGGQAHLELLPLTYTFSMTYASGRQEKSQNIAINPTVVFQTTTVTVELRTSAGNLITDPGTVQYYAGGWRTFGTTSGGQAHLELLPLTYTFSMTYASGRQEKSQNVAANATVVFQTTTVTIELRTSAGNLITDPGTVQYYAGGWRTFGTTSGGQAHLELLPLTYTFSMTYASGRQEKPQNIAINSTVVFQTTTVTVELRTSAGNLITDPATVQYYAGGWRTFGTTSGGQAHLELLPLTYTFSMTYASGRQEKSQNIAINQTVVFQTTTVTIQLESSAGGPLDSGSVQYYASGWRTVGTTSGGQMSVELLPLTYTFSMSYGGARQEKSQNTAVGATIVFQTGAARSETGMCTQYYAGGWRAFSQDMELLPLTYKFRFNDGTSEGSYTITPATTNRVH